MRDYFFSRQDRVVKLLIVIYTNPKQRYYVMNTKSLKVQSGDYRVHYLLGGDVNPDFDSWGDISSFETSRFFDKDGLFQ